MPHVTADLYRLAIAGELPPRLLAKLLHRHLIDLCHRCGMEWREVAPRLADAAERRAMALAPAAVAEVSPRKLQQQADAVRRAQRAARQGLQKLLETPPEQWRKVVGQSRSRFRSRATVELVVEHGLELTRSDPRLAERLLAFVPELLIWVPGGLGTAWARDLATRAEARRANALRVGGDLAGADRRFELVRERLAASPATDPTLYAEAASLEASLRVDYSRYDEAAALLDRATYLYHEAGDSDGLARALIQRAEIAQHFSRHAEALADLLRARELLDPDEQPFLYVCTVVATVPTLLDLGRPAEAERLLQEAELAFAAAIEPFWSLRFRHLAGRAAHDQGHHGRALRLLREARRGFVELERPYDVAAVSLDLALVHLDRGDTAHAARLAKQIAPVFKSVGVEREALATLRVLRQAGAEEGRKHLAALHRLLAAARAERGRRAGR